MKSGVRNEWRRRRAGERKEKLPTQKPLIIPRRSPASFHTVSSQEVRHYSQRTIPEENSIENFVFIGGFAETHNLPPPESTSCPKLHHTARQEERKKPWNDESKEYASMSEKQSSAG